MIKAIKDDFRILINGNTLPVLVDNNISIEYIIAELIGNIFKVELTNAESMKDILESMNKLIIFWDKDTKVLDTLTINHFEFVEDFDLMFKFKKSNNDPLPSIKLWSAYDFQGMQSRDIETYNEMMSHPYVVIGPLNKINPTTFNAIMNAFPINLRILYGDDKLDSPENNNYHNMYLSNSNAVMTIPYYSGRDIKEKKVNSVIDKLRKPSCKLADLSNAVIKFIETEAIDTSIIIDCLEDEETLVVVPHRLKDDVNSRLIEIVNGNDDLNLKVGQYVYNTYAFKVDKNSNLDGVEFVIEPLTKIWIARIVRKYVNRGSYFVECDIQVKHNDKLIVVHGVQFDWCYYLMQFNKSYHLENQADYNTIDYKYLNSNNNIWKPNVLKCIPFRVTTVNYAKYRYFNRVIAFMETIDSWMLERHPTDLYGYVASCISETIVYKAYVFDDVI